MVMSSLTAGETELTTEQVFALFDALSQGIAIVDSDETLLFWNAWVSDWTGIAAAEAMGKSLPGLFPRLVAGEFLLALEALAVTGNPFEWTQDSDPERLDAVESAMTRGDRQQPLQRIACKRFTLGDRRDLCLIEIVEQHSPSETVVPRRKQPAMPTAPIAASGVAVNLVSDKYGILAIDKHGFIQKINSAMARMLGFEETELHDKPIRILFPALDEDESGEGYRQIVEAAQQRQREGTLEAATASGNMLRLEVQVFDGIADNGEVKLLCRDVTRSSGVQDALLRQREQLSAIYSHVTDAVLMVDRRGYLENCNAVATEMLALGHRRNDQAYVEDVLRLKDAEDKWVYPFSQAMSRERTVSLLDDIHLVVAGNPSIPVAVTATPVRDRQNRISGCVIVMRAISESRRVSSRLSWHETHDPLTQLANRREIENEIVRAIDASHVDNISHLLLYIDLYNFSVVNDTCGHAAGDELLRQFGRLMTQSVEGRDVVARIGNDEFAVLLWGREPAVAQEEAEGLLKKITEFSLPWEERRLKVGASIGVQPINRTSTSEIDIMLSANAACAAAKEAGRNRIHYQHLSQDSFRRHSLSKWTARISDALEENRFVVYCQPIVAIKGNSEVKHYEALVRMLDPEGKIVPPGKFIPAAESSGLIDDVDRWVMDKVFDTLEALPRQKQAQYAFSVNLSGNTVCDEKFLDHVIGRLKSSVLPPGVIRFEITETAAVKHFDRAVRFIRTLNELGCSFSLDDFGSGLSSFGYLKQLPVDNLKIDGSFVRKMEVGDVEYSMVSTINHLAHIMGLETIAECVENQAQLSMLEEMGVDYAQGYLISPPVPLDTIL